MLIGLVDFQPPVGSFSGADLCRLLFNMKSNKKVSLTNQRRQVTLENRKNGQFGRLWEDQHTRHWRGGLQTQHFVEQNGKNEILILKKVYQHYKGNNG